MLFAFSIFAQRAFAALELPRSVEPRWGGLSSVFSHHTRACLLVNRRAASDTARPSQSGTGLRVALHTARRRRPPVRQSRGCSWVTRLRAVSVGDFTDRARSRAGADHHRRHSRAGAVATGPLRSLRASQQTRSRRSRTLSSIRDMSEQTVEQVCRRRMRRLATPKNLGFLRCRPSGLDAARIRGQGPWKAFPRTVRNAERRVMQPMSTGRRSQPSSRRIRA
jgi:hypothetical protein